MDDVVHDQLLRAAGGGGAEHGGQFKRIAQADTLRAGGEGGLRARLLAGAEQGEGARVAALHQGAQGVAHDPAGAGVGAVPAGDEVEHALRMVLGDVVEVVGDGFAHVERSVGAQRGQQGQGGGRVGDESLERPAPGQARARTLAGEPAHMLIVYPRGGHSELTRREG